VTISSNDFIFTEKSLAALMKSTIFALEESLAGRLAAGFAPLPRDTATSV
jgi:hypothetical protein